MVRHCVAYGCTEKFIKGGPVTFHRFPKDEKMRTLWEIKIRRQDFKAKETSTICSKHFTADCFNKNKLGGTWLKKDAVPTIFDFSAKTWKKKIKVEENTDIHCESTAREDMENGTKIKKKGNIDIHSGCDKKAKRMILLISGTRVTDKDVEECLAFASIISFQEIVTETPSPQIVGHEFVRQYYGLLCKAPSHLYRFYKDDSIFLHQRLDGCERDTRPVVGQQDIQESMKRLGFHNCRVKIIKIDCLDTVGNGLVVLVTGELSNNGGPMRRFTQTFVLVLLAPKKYYVRNNIFRYQDKILSEDDNESKTCTMVSKNTRSNSASRSLPVSSNTIYPVFSFPLAHKMEQASVFKAEGTPVSAGQANKDKNEEIALPGVSADDSCSIGSDSEKYS